MRKKKAGLAVLIFLVLFAIGCSVSLAVTPGISITNDGISIGASGDPASVASSIRLLLLSYRIVPVAPRFSS